MSILVSGKTVAIGPLYLPTPLFEKMLCLLQAPMDASLSADPGPSLRIGNRTQLVAVLFQPGENALQALYTQARRPFEPGKPELCHVHRLDLGLVQQASQSVGLPTVELHVRSSIAWVRKPATATRHIDRMGCGHD